MNKNMKARYNVHFALPRHTDSNTHNLTKAMTSLYLILRNYDRRREILEEALNGIDYDD